MELTCNCCCRWVISAILSSLDLFVLSRSCLWVVSRHLISWSFPSSWCFLSFFNGGETAVVSAIADIPGCTGLDQRKAVLTRASNSNSSVFLLAFRRTMPSCSLFLWFRSSCLRFRSHSSCRCRSSSRFAACGCRRLINFLILTPCKVS